jgi:catechol 2,3-dioxygenase-like lactoylglutathione lyase family enzyme
MRDPSGGTEIAMTMSMSLRLELFVRDMDASIDFYRRALGFELTRREPDYASLRSGTVTLGLGPIAKLPADGGYFTPARLADGRGAGVEIVLEVDDVAAYHQCVKSSGHAVLHALGAQPWGLTDFRITDPDGYYLRITSRQ